MSIKPICTDADHAAAVARMEQLWDAAPGSAAAAELDALATLADAYEARQVTIPPARPVEVLRYAITEMGHTQAELAAILGSRSRASEVLNGKRELTVDMIRKISAAWRIPAELLIGVEDAAAA
ncbi:MAG: helix-turn-helix domain-containing protein, partial [Methylobacteriaceae bacterium]|nr:helix-turn-helix domain-containing protein [Methylobacteriaceae bacterium]MCO5087994.1 helix-turn-helix domain-containing protein [Methylobacteriaceae bacterium]